MPISTVPAAESGSPAIRLSDLFVDPAVREVFRRAEDGFGSAFTVSAPRPKPQLNGGAAAGVFDNAAIASLLAF